MGQRRGGPGVGARQPQPVTSDSVGLRKVIVTAVIAEKKKPQNFRLVFFPHREKGWQLRGKSLRQITRKSKRQRIII